ncbi:MAG: 3-phosphoshikimate 1-carboxyvinyltransferase [Muribaculaceae bacterium]|nr:3-phosphoshikimate 1-carboxyvinyltransferase [Muribaculaceae bacterium]
MDYRIFPPEELIEASVDLPLSKSVLNRALILNALSGKSADNIAWQNVCDDIDVLAAALDSEGNINAGRSGTAMRFLTAYYAAKDGCEVTLDGDERLRQRPLGVLVEALRVCGADIEWLGAEGFLPVKIRGRRLSGGEVTIDASVSSQFVSALLMVAPTMDNGLTLHLDSEHIASEPYIRLTMNMMQEAGADLEREGDTITVKKSAYDFHYVAETDWSAAAFWYEIEALTMGFLTLTKLSEDSLQPDRAAAKVFGELGVVTDFEAEDGGTELSGSPDISPRLRLDMVGTPDLVPALVVASCLLRVPFHLTGVATLRLKECDRVEALITELGRLGVVIDSPNADTIEWEGRTVPVGEMPVFQTYNDHRMAMALAPISVYIPGIVVRDAEVVNKSYPGYWEALRAAGFTVEEVVLAAEQPAEEKEAE